MGPLKKEKGLFLRLFQRCSHLLSITLSNEPPKHVKEKRTVSSLSLSFLASNLFHLTFHYAVILALVLRVTMDWSSHMCQVTCIITYIFHKQVLLDDGKAERVILAHPSGIDGAQEAVTAYRVMGPTIHGCSWIELRPLIGRKHQVPSTQYYVLMYQDN